MCVLLKNFFLFLNLKNVQQNKEKHFNGLSQRSTEYHEKIGCSYIIQIYQPL